MNVIRYARMSLEVITVPVTLVMFCKTAHIVLILMSALQIKRIIVIHWQLVRTLQVFSTVLVTVVLLGMEHFAKISTSAFQQPRTIVSNFAIIPLAVTTAHAEKATQT